MAKPAKPRIPAKRGAHPSGPLPGVPRGRSNQVGLQVRALRMAAGLTQQALQARIAVTGYPLDQSRIAKIESGKRSVWDYEVPLLARALRVPVSRLYEK